MSAAEFRRPLPHGESLDKVLADLGPGQGVSLVRYKPYWDVVVRRKKGTKTAVEYVVTDSSRPGVKPLLVFGPVTKLKKAEEWARNTQQAWIATHVFFSADSFEYEGQ